MIKAMKRDEKGFTLVELVVVIAILAILALLLVPRIIGSVDDAKNSRAIADARTIASEITTQNAIENAKETPDTSKIIPGPATLAATDMTIIGRDAADFPDSTIVEILIDSDGNATIDPK